MHTLIRFKEFIKAVLLGSALLTSQQALANTPPLTLTEALGRARSANPELEALRHQAEGATARIGTAGALPDPKAQVTYFGQSVETRTGPQEAIYSISQNIPWLSKLRTREALATHDAETSALLYQAGRLHIEEALTQAYSETAYYLEAVRTTESNLRWIEDSQQIVEEQVRGGAALNALLRLEVEMERARDQLDRFRQKQFTYRTRLAALMGIEESELGELAEIPLPNLSTMDAEALQAELIRANPELLALKERIRSADTEVALSRLDRFPDFTFGVNYIQVGDNGANFSDAGRDPWNITVAFSLPIWEGKNSAAIQVARSEERAAFHLYRNRLLQLKADLSASLTRHADSLRRMQRYEATLIPLAEQALENSQAAYESGQVTALEIIDSERALLDLRLSHARALAEALQAEARIERLVGDSLVKTDDPQPDSLTISGLHQ